LEQGRGVVFFLAGLFCWCCGRFVALQHTVGQVAELQFLEQRAQLLFVRFLYEQAIHVEFDGHIRLDGGQEAGELDFFCMFFYFLLERSFQLVGVGQQILDTAKFSDEFQCRLLAYARTSGDVVR